GTAEGAEGAEDTPDVTAEGAAEASGPAEDGNGEDGNGEDAAAAAQERETPAPVAEPLPPLPSPEERQERLLALLSSTDEIRRRDAEVSTSVVWGALVLPVWEAFERSDVDGAAWLDSATHAWTERVRMTRRDKDTLWLLLKGLEQLR